MGRKLTAKSLLREVRQLKKQAGGSMVPSWTHDLWEYSDYGQSTQSRASRQKGEASAKAITDQSKYVAKHFMQFLKQNGLNIRLEDVPLDDGNNTDLRKVWGGQMSGDGMVAWGFFNNDGRPYVMFDHKTNAGRPFRFYKEAPDYKDGDPIKQIGKARAWLHEAIEKLQREWNIEKLQR